MENEEEIIKSLKVIREICKENLCDKCPFSNENVSCLINDKHLCDWEVIEPEPQRKLLYYEVER